MLQNVAFRSLPSDLGITQEPLLNQEGFTNNGDDFEQILSTEEDKQNPFTFQMPLLAQSVQIPTLFSETTPMSLDEQLKAMELMQAQFLAGLNTFQPQATLQQALGQTFGQINSPVMVAQQPNLLEQTPFAFSPTLFPFATDGLDQALLTGEQAGVTDGKELVNLANKFIIQFELEPEVVQKEFSKLAVMTPEQVSTFNLGEMFERIGVEPKELDVAYQLVQDVVEREMIKNEFRNVAELSTVTSSLPSAAALPVPANLGSDKFEELLLASKFATKNQNMASKVNPHYVDNGRMIQAAVNKADIETGESFDDFMSKQDQSSFVSTLQSSTPKTTVNFNASTPINVVEMKNPLDVGVLNNAIVQDARILVKDGGGKMEITLNPVNMGKLQVVVDTSGKNVNVEVVCSNAHVKQMLESQMPELKLAMSGVGLLTGKVHINLAGGSSNAGFESKREDTYAYQEQSKNGANPHAWNNKNKRERQKNS